ncbi:MAG: hypothetical protein HC880_21200 [Bacteroidia bacterium]|nr:hypothetical protein [Bacteroidia bacterium]
MNKMNNPVHLVGSIPGDTVEGVFQMCSSAIGNIASALPDGELESRNTWVNFLAWNVYQHHPDMETLSRPQIIPGKADWIPAGYEDVWLFKIKEGRNAIHYEKLGYADHAKSSYQKFVELKEQGVIPPQLRFQVCLPATESSFRWFWPEPGDFQILWDAYHDAIAREIEQITAAIPAESLLIQWDVCMEVLAVEAGDSIGHPPMAWKGPGDVFDRYVQDISYLGGLIPKDVPMGIHLCYGDLGHQHLIQPSNLAVCVQMANAAVANLERSVDYFHMPVPRDRKDDEYFAPLKDLNIGNAKVFIGLIHHTDGIEGSLARLETAKRHISNFGISTECGFGRRPVEQIPELLHIHQEVAKAI